MTENIDYVELATAVLEAADEERPPTFIEQTLMLLARRVIELEKQAKGIKKCGDVYMGYFCTHPSAHPGPHEDHAQRTVWTDENHHE